jgi:hypothetical protein
LRSWIISSLDFYSDSFPPDPDAEEDDSEDNESGEQTDWLALWALCISMGVPDSEWENMTYPKIRALSKLRNRMEEFDIILHGGKIDKKPKKAKTLADLGIF